MIRNILDSLFTVLFTCVAAVFAAGMMWWSLIPSILLAILLGCLGGFRLVKIASGEKDSNG